MPKITKHGGPTNVRAAERTVAPPVVVEPVTTDDAPTPPPPPPAVTTEVATPIVAPTDESRSASGKRKR